MSRPKRFKVGSSEDPKACRMCKVQGTDFKLDVYLGKNRRTWTCKQCGHKNTSYADPRESGWNDPIY